jgi:hypothetical protein
LGRREIHPFERSFTFSGGLQHGIGVPIPEIAVNRFEGNLMLYRTWMLRLSLTVLPVIALLDGVVRGWRWP